MKNYLAKFVSGCLILVLMLQLCGCGSQVLVSSELGGTTTTTSRTEGELISGGFKTVDNPTKSDYELPDVTLKNKKLKIFVGVHEDDSDWHSKFAD